MHICEGRSLELDADSAVAEAVAGWTQAPDLVLVFSSPVRPAEQVARSLAARFPAAQIVGCTTAGEHLSGAHSNGGLVVTGISSPKLRWATVMIEDLASADEASIRATVGSLFERLAIDSTSFDARRYFCLQFVDGLSGAEERVTPLVADALDGITLIGGSAGDDLAFRRTEVIHGGQARSGAAVLALCECGLDFQLMKHQHFVTTARTLAITKADVAHRRVYELDGEPAARVYARALGVARDQLDDQLTFEHPLTFRYQHELYVRSVQQVHPDDSMSFYCAIEEGMVVDVGAHEELVPALEGGLAKLSGGRQIGLLIGSNCILRALETKARNQHDDVGRLFAQRCRHMIGFDTYGEQLDGLHINQTLVALALFDRAEAA